MSIHTELLLTLYNLIWQFLHQTEQPVTEQDCFFKKNLNPDLIISHCGEFSKKALESHSPDASLCGLLLFWVVY